MADKVSEAFAVDYFIYEEDIEEDDDDIVPYFSSTCIRRDRVPSVRTFYEEVFPDFSSLDFKRHFRITKQMLTFIS